MANGGRNIGRLLAGLPEGPLSALGRVGFGVGTLGLSEVFREDALREQRQQEAAQQAHSSFQNAQSNLSNPPQFLINEAQASQNPQEALEQLSRKLQSDVSQSAAVLQPEFAARQALTPPPQRKLTKIEVVNAAERDGGLTTPQAKQLRFNILNPKSLVNIQPGNIQETAQQKAVGKGRGQVRAKQEEAIDVAATSAGEVLSNIGLLEQQLTEVDVTGKLVPLISMGFNIMQSMGLPLTDKAGKKLTATETITALTKDIVIASAKKLGANPSNADRAAIEAANASLGKSKEANLRWLDIQRAKKEADIRVSEIKDESLDLTGTELRKRVREYLSTDPVLTRFNDLQGLRAKASSAVPQVTPVGQDPQIAQPTEETFADRLLRAEQRRGNR